MKSLYKTVGVCQTQQICSETNAPQNNIKCNQLLKNAHKLNGIPGKIVQGRYDLLCPPINAHNIAEKWEDSDLIFVDDAGHTANSGIMKQSLIEAINNLVDEVK